MTNHEHHGHEKGPEESKLSKSKLVLIGFLVVAGYFLVTEHRAHVVPYLPYLLILACPLMHIFMHGGHGGHQHGNSGNENNKKGES